LANTLGETAALVPTLRERSWPAVIVGRVLELADVAVALPERLGVEVDRPHRLQKVTLTR
jgi:hypothetical protein